MTHLPSHEDNKAQALPTSRQDFCALHVADLHIPVQGAEFSYAWSVWEEILSIAANLKLDAMLLSGDIFDQYASFHTHHQKFFHTLSDLSCPVVYIFGNHEFLGAPAELPAFSKPQALHLATIQAEWFVLGAARLLAVPHGSQAHAKLPAPEAPLTLGVAHGEPSHFNFPIDEDDREEGGRRLDEEFFRSAHFDLVACGHIHKRMSYHSGATLFHFPGSSRVWRKGEVGPRTISLIEMSKNQSPRITPIPLQQAGLIRSLELKMPAEQPSLLHQLNLQQVSRADYLEIQVSGHIGLLSQWQNQMQQIEKECLRYARKVRFVDNDLVVLGPLLDHPMLQTFLQHFATCEQRWELSGTNINREVVDTARQLGIKYIHQQLTQNEEL